MPAVDLTVEPGSQRVLAIRDAAAQHPIARMLQRTPGSPARASRQRGLDTCDGSRAGVIYDPGG